MLHAFFEPVSEVLRLNFSGSFTSDDLDAIDPLIIECLAEGDRARGGARILYDLSAIQGLEVPSARFAERARSAPLGKLTRVVVAPPWARTENFGRSYRDARAVTSHSQPIIVPTLPEAYRLLSLVDPRFEPLGHASSTENASDDTRYRVLVVEDDVLISMLMEDDLRDTRFDVTHFASNLEQGLLLAERLPLDAAILDVNLNGQFSFPIADVLRHRKIPFMFCTAYDRATLPLSFQSAPALHKPFSKRELLTTLLALVQQETD